MLKNRTSLITKKIKDNIVAEEHDNAGSKREYELFQAIDQGTRYGCQL